jgi:hypothetical protein
MIEADVLAAVIPVLDQLQSQGVPHNIGGSVASSILGVARSTLDVDVVADLREEHAGEFCGALEGSYYIDEGAVREAVRRRSSFNVIHLATVLKVDVFCLGDRPFDRAAFARARHIEIGVEGSTRELPVASPEDMVLHKLEWFRMGGEVSERQWGDVLGLLRVQAGVLDLGYLRHWALELKVADLLEKARAESES